MTYVYHIVTIRVNKTSWAHVWRLHFRYLGTGYDNDLGINYHPGKANVVADALSQRSHVSQLVVDSMPFELCEEFDKLNLRVIANTEAMEMDVGSSLL
jgi:hypothetical protein